MDQPLEFWTLVYRYVPHPLDIARMWLTGDHRAAQTLLGARRLALELPKQTWGSQTLQMLRFICNLRMLEELELIDSIGGLSQEAWSPDHILPLALLEALPPTLKAWKMTSKVLSIHPKDLGVLPRGLQRLEMPICFPAEKQRQNVDFVAFPVGVWPSLTALSFTGSTWNFMMTEAEVRSLPASLTRLEINALPLDFRTAISSPFEHLINVLWYTVMPVEVEKTFFPPNVTDVCLQHTMVPHKFYNFLPPSVRHLSALTSNRKRAPHPTFMEQDFEVLPRGLETLRTHEVTRFKNLDILRNTVPPGLTAAEFSSVPLDSLQALPNTLREMNVQLTEGDMPNLLGKLFPQLSRISLVSTWRYTLPMDFYSGWPQDTLTSIDLGSQENVPEEFFDNLSKLAPHLQKLSASHQPPSLKAAHLKQLPPKLTYLSIPIKNLDFNDQDVAALPRSLTYLALICPSISDASVPLLPPQLEALQCETSSPFTIASIHQWPCTLRKLTIPAHPSLSKSIFSSQFKKELKIELIQSTH